MNTEILNECRYIQALFSLLLLLLLVLVLFLFCYTHALIYFCHWSVFMEENLLRESICDTIGMLHYIELS